jgi:hypothetical protein
MNRSIFDPSSPEAEHSGSRNLGPVAADISPLRTDKSEGLAPDPDAPDTSPDLKEIAKDEADAIDQTQSPRSD